MLYIPQPDPYVQFLNSLPWWLKATYDGLRVAMDLAVVGAFVFVTVPERVRRRWRLRRKSSPIPQPHTKRSGKLPDPREPRLPFDQF